MTDREAIELLKGLLSTYSPSGEEAGAVVFLAEQLSASGLAVEVDEVGNLIATCGEPPMKGGVREPDLLLLGHIDTVPGYIPVREEGGKLYGRGAVDAKGALCAFSCALIRCRKALEGASVVLVAAVGEEAEGEGAKHILPCFRPKMVIIGEPSGWQGITLGYKGRLVVTWLLELPTNHSASPRPSALEQAFVFGRRLSLLARRFNRGKTGAFQRLDVAPRNISFSSDGLRDRVELELTLRLPPGLAAEALKGEIRKAAGEATVSFRGGEAAFLAPKNTPLVRAFLQAIRAEGGRPRFKLKTGTSDMNVVGPVWGCPILAYGPGDSALDHTPHEHLELSEFLKAAKVLEKALLRLSGNREGSSTQARGPQPWHSHSPLQPP